MWPGERKGEIRENSIEIVSELIIYPSFLSENLDKFETFGVADRSPNITLITDNIKAGGCR